MHMCGRTQSLCFSRTSAWKKKKNIHCIRNSSTYFSRFSVSTRCSGYLFFLLFFRAGISSSEILYFLATPFLRQVFVKITLPLSLNFQLHLFRCRFTAKQRLSFAMRIKLLESRRKIQRTIISNIRVNRTSWEPKDHISYIGNGMQQHVVR